MHCRFKAALSLSDHSHFFRTLEGIRLHAIYGDGDALPLVCGKGKNFFYRRENISHDGRLIAARLVETDRLQFTLKLSIGPIISLTLSFML